MSLQEILKLLQSNKLEQAIDAMKSAPDLWLALNKCQNDFKFFDKSKSETDIERERIRTEALKRVNLAIKLNLG